MYEHNILRVFSVSNAKDSVRKPTDIRKLSGHTCY